jgi:mono/diheme cytochrome c family protein
MDDRHTAETVARGRLLYTRNCAACHGGAAISGGVLPDLRNAGPSVHENWNAIVLDGMLEDRGMGRFADRLSAAEAESIRAYVLFRAHQTWGEAQRR